ncbi:MAG: HmuY family protein [Myxococcota bacterium]
MRLPLVPGLVLPIVLLVGAASCGAAKTCTPQSCSSGCCSEAGECLSGGENSACGASGNACVNCAQSGQVCGDKVCVASGSGGGSGGGGGSNDAGTGGGGGGADAGSFMCTRTNVECSDSAIANLGLLSNLNTGTLANGEANGDFLATIDTRAGGQSPTESYVYVRFTPFGLEKLQLTDIAALDSMDWDMAFRRFVIRLNSGDSGPSCVAAQVQSVPYEQITAVPANYLPEGDNFLDRPPACTFIDDGSGLTTSPNTYLASFYQYQGCVRMTKKAYVIRTQTGRHVKFTVSTYYATEAAQQMCDTSGSTGGALGGTVRVRWRYLD